MRPICVDAMRWNQRLQVAAVWGSAEGTVVMDEVSSGRRTRDEILTGCCDRLICGRIGATTAATKTLSSAKSFRLGAFCCDAAHLLTYPWLLDHAVHPTLLFSHRHITQATARFFDRHAPVKLQRFVEPSRRINIRYGPFHCLQVSLSVRMLC